MIIFRVVFPIFNPWQIVDLSAFCQVFEMKVIGAHKGIILGRVRELHRKLAVGEIEEMVITTAAQHHLVGGVGPDDVVVMTLRRDALPAVALRRLRSAVELFKKEIC